MSVVRWLAIVLLGICLGACGGRAEVVDPDVELNLSGNWNDSDAHKVAATVGDQLLAGAWVETYRERTGRQPIVRVGHLRVRTRALDDEIDTSVITNDLVRQLIASGRVRAVADRAEAALQRDERGDVLQHAATAPVTGQELAPDLILSGSVITQDDQVLDPGLAGGTYKQVKFYQADFSLTDVVTNEVVWRGSVERKKLIEQSTLGW